MKVRLSFTFSSPNGTTLSFTPRGGKTDQDRQKGFVRVKGKTISGWIGNPDTPVVSFFENLDGKNARLLDELRCEDNRKAFGEQQQQVAV